MTDKIVLPVEVKESFEQITDDEMNALRWVGYLFTQNILRSKVAGFTSFLSKAEEDNAVAISAIYKFDNQTLRGSCLWCVAGLIERGYADVSAIGHVETFFEDLLKMGVKR